MQWCSGACYVCVRDGTETVNAVGGARCGVVCGVVRGRDCAALLEYWERVISCFLTVNPQIFMDYHAVFCCFG